MSQCNSNIFCQICNKEFRSSRSLSIHLRKYKLTSEEYFNIYLSTNKNNICKICGSITSFENINKGYRQYCSVQCRKSDKELQQANDKKMIITLKNNPEILEKANEKRKQTYKENPEILIKSHKKRLKTYKDNPEKINKIYEKISITIRNKFAKISESDSMIPHFLYIIQHLEKPIIKIGRSEDPNRRLDAIINDFGPCIILHTLEGPYNKIQPLESYLHNHLNDYCCVQESGSGRTEWFCESILEDVIKAIYP